MLRDQKVSSLLLLNILQEYGNCFTLPMLSTKHLSPPHPVSLSEFYYIKFITPKLNSLSSNIKKRKTKDNLRKMEFDRVPFRDNVSRESALQANKSTTRKKSMT